MSNVETIIGLLFITVILSLITRRFLIPYPAIFTAGGILLSFIPHLPQVVLDPHIVFVLFVPPILFYTAYFTSWRDFRKNFRTISLLAFVLVAVSTFSIAAIFKWLMPHVPWALGCVLGAIISPPDAISATAVTSRLQMPRGITTILEGESLINDASALILYKFAVAAVVTSDFLLHKAILNFFVAGVMGIFLGLLLGWCMVLLTRKLDDDPTIMTILSLLTPLVTYIIAEKLEISGVLAVVAAGLIFGWHAPKTLTASMRLRSMAVWETFVFLINGVVFILIGLQLRTISEGLGAWTHSELALFTLVIVVTIILIRFIWVFFAAYGLRTLFPWLRQRHPYPSWKGVFIVAWSGMRGIVSLGAALALPLYIRDGAPFPARDLIIFLTFASIACTLFLQGMALPFLIKWLGMKDDGIAQYEERLAREAIAKVMLKQVEKLSHMNTFSSRAIDLTRRECLLYATRYLDEADKEAREYLAEVRSIRKNMIQTGRKKLIALRHQGTISDEVMHTIQAEFDLDEMRLNSY